MHALVKSRWLRFGGKQEYPEKAIGIYSMHVQDPDWPDGTLMSPDLFVFEAAADEGFSCGELIAVRKLLKRRI